MTNIKNRTCLNKEKLNSVLAMVRLGRGGATLKKIALRHTISFLKGYNHTFSIVTLFKSGKFTSTLVIDSNLLLDLGCKHSKKSWLQSLEKNCPFLYNASDIVECKEFLVTTNIEKSELLQTLLVDLTKIN